MSKLIAGAGLVDTKALARYTWAEAARHCPELFLPAWIGLAASYGEDGEMLPSITRITVYEDGLVTLTHCAYRVKAREMAGLRKPVERKVRPSPFGDGSDAAAKAKAYVEQKREEIKAAKAKHAEAQRKIARFLKGM